MTATTMKNSSFVEFETSMEEQSPSPVRRQTRVSTMSPPSSPQIISSQPLAIDTSAEESPDEGRAYEEMSLPQKYCLQLTPAGSVVKCPVQQAGFHDDELLKEKKGIEKMLPFIGSSVAGALKKRPKKKSKKKKKKRKEKGGSKQSREESKPSFCLQLTEEGEVALCRPDTDTSLVIHGEESSELFMDETNSKACSPVSSLKQSKNKGVVLTGRPLSSSPKQANDSASSLPSTPRDKVVEHGSSKPASPVFSEEDDHNDYGTTVITEIALDEETRQATASPTTPRHTQQRRVHPPPLIVTPSPHHEGDGDSDGSSSPIRNLLKARCLVSTSPFLTRQEKARMNDKLRNEAMTPTKLSSSRELNSSVTSSPISPIQKLNGTPTSVEESSLDFELQSSMDQEMDSSYFYADDEGEEDDGDFDEDDSYAEEEDRIYMQLTPDGDVIQCLFSEDASPDLHPVFFPCHKKIEATVEATNRKPLVHRFLRR